MPSNYDSICSLGDGINSNQYLLDCHFKLRSCTSERKVRKTCLKMKELWRRSDRERRWGGKRYLSAKMIILSYPSSKPQSLWRPSEELANQESVRLKRVDGYLVIPCVHHSTIQHSSHWLGGEAHSHTHIL